MQHRRLRDNQDGQSVVEAVLVLPLILLILFGMVAFAQIIHSNSMVLLAANQAARQGAVLYGKPTVLPSDAQQQVEAVARGVITNNLSGSDFTINVVADATNVSVTIVYHLHVIVPWWKTITGSDIVTAQHTATYRIEPS